MIEKKEIGEESEVQGIFPVNPSDERAPRIVYYCGFDVNHFFESEKDKYEHMANECP